MPRYAGAAVPVSTTAGCSSISANKRRAEAKVCVRFAGSALNASVGPNELAISTTPVTNAGMSDGETTANATASAADAMVSVMTSTVPMPAKPPLTRLRRACSAHSDLVRSTMTRTRSSPHPNPMISPRPRMSSSITSSSSEAWRRIVGPRFCTPVAKNRGTTTPMTRCATTSSPASAGLSASSRQAYTTLVITAITTGEMVCAKKISSSSTSVVISAIRSPLPLPASFAGASRRSAAKDLERKSASRRKATLWLRYCST